MDVPVMVVIVARRMEVLHVPGERILGVTVIGQHLVSVDPGDRTASQDDRQHRADQPGSRATLRICGWAVLFHVSRFAKSGIEPETQPLASPFIISTPLALLHC